MWWAAAHKRKSVWWNSKKEWRTLKKCLFPSMKRWATSQNFGLFSNTPQFLVLRWALDPKTINCVILSSFYTDHLTHSIWSSASSLFLHERLPIFFVFDFTSNGTYKQGCKYNLAIRALLQGWCESSQNTRHLFIITSSFIDIVTICVYCLRAIAVASCKHSRAARSTLFVVLRDISLL